MVNGNRFHTATPIYHKITMVTVVTGNFTVKVSFSKLGNRLPSFFSS